jgi:RNA polymerase sigma factor for flagellar operon FliA
MVDGLRKLDIVPRSVRTKVTEVQAAQVTLEHRLGRTPKDEELAAEVGITLRALRTLYAKISLGNQATLDGFDLADELATAAASGVAEDLEVNQSLLHVVAELAERDRIIIALYYFERLTMAEIGVVLGVTEARISQAHCRATLLLRTKMLAADSD